MSFRILSYEQALNYEVQVAGAVLLDPQIVLGELSTLVPRLRAEDFTSARCAAIYEAANRLWLNRDVLDAATICEAARAIAPDGEISMEQFCGECMEVTPTTANCRRHAKGVQELARACRLDDLAHQLLDAATMEEKDVIVTQMQKLSAPDTAIGKVKWMDGLRACYQRIGNPEMANYLHWGLEKLDEHLKIRPGGFVILGGYASAGKTAFATQLALQIAYDGHNVCFYSIETDDETLYDRMIAQISGANFERIQSRTAVDADYQAIMAASARTEAMRFDFQNAAGWTVEQIQADALANRYDVIFIDYVQLIESTAPVRSEEVAKVSRSLHRFAQQTKTIVVGLSQLTPTDHYPPTMNDLRESRQLTQDADAILILYEPREEGSLDTDRVLKIAKNKQGRCGTVDLTLDANTMRMLPEQRHYDEDEELNSRGFAKQKAPPRKDTT